MADPWGIIAPGVVKVKEVVLQVPEEIQDVLGVQRNLAGEIMKDWLFLFMRKEKYL